jgi:predicted acetyltransferase
VRYLSGGCGSAPLRYSGGSLQRASDGVLHMDENQSNTTSVELTDAGPADAALIQNLMQLYTHDFSEFWAGTSRGDLDADGRFAPYPLAEYWSRMHWSAALISCGGKLAGFALINDMTHSGLPAQRNVAEFFVIRKYRGNGVGRAAANIVFSRHPGSWEVAVARRNTRALQFWRRMIRDSSKSSRIEEMDVQSDVWNGPVLRFDWSMLAT